MAYLEAQQQTNRTAAVVGVVAIHAAMGYVLVSGLATTVVETFMPPNPEGTNVEIELPPPPPPPETKPDPIDKPAPAPDTNIFTPEPIIDIIDISPSVSTTDMLDDVNTDIVITPGRGPIDSPGTERIIEPQPDPAPTFDPISASPRNNPGEWVTTSDYRSSWINREYTGIARFKVSVGTNGRAQNCEILSSTGHSALDQATCKLIKQRARFNAAKNSNGEKVTGSYTNSVRWQLPD